MVLISVHSLLFAGDLGRLCDLINNQKYSKALKVFESIDEISVEESSVNIYNLEAFLDYAYEKNISYDTFNRLLYWYAEELIAYADLLTILSGIENLSIAEKYYLSAIEIYGNLEGITSPIYLQQLKNLFLFYSEQNDLEKSIVVLENIIEIDKFNSDTLTLCSDYNALGGIFYRRGENFKSDSIYKVADNVLATIENYEIYKLYDITYNMVRFLGYFHYRDFDRALNKCDELVDKINKYNSSPVIKAICNTYKGAILLSQKKNDESEQILTESYEILQEVSNNGKHKDIFLLASLLKARLRFCYFDFSGAKQYLEPLLLDKPSELTEQYWLYISAVNELTVIHFFERDYIKAYELIKECLELYEFTYSIGVNQYEYSNSLFQQSLIQERLGLIEESYTSALKSYDIARELVRQNLSFLSEEQRTEYWNDIQFRFTNEYPNLFYKSRDLIDSVGTVAYNNELFYKGILLSTTQNIRSSILESGDSSLVKLFDEMQKIQSLLLNDEFTFNQKELIQRRNDIDKLLINKSRAYAERNSDVEYSWKDVQMNLDEEEVAVEFSSLMIYRDRYADSTMYCALLLRHNSKYPELIPLFEEKEVASYLDKTTEGSTNNLYSFEGEGEYISNIVWSKILSKIKPGETIYFAPTGILHQLAIEYLPYDEQRTMSDVYNMVRLSSTREIVTNKSKESYKSAVVYGGIHYDLDNNVILEESNRYPEVKHRTLENDSINRGSAKFLPGTKAEAEKINKLLSDNKIEVKIFKTKTANEESFKSLSGKHNNILHIATHGFTWADSTARKQDYFADRMKMQLMGDNQMRGPIIDPLDRCGLLFAGANTALQGKSKELPEGVQDGILTAKEISLMDLRDAELVVLSACETAKGDITSEGVFGLQRAFKMAGAKTIIMSLWKVDDRATQLLMTEFYNNWINKKQSKREAFRDAQNSVKEEFKKPEYWAGFIMLD